MWKLIVKEAEIIVFKVPNTLIQGMKKIPGWNFIY